MTGWGGETTLDVEYAHTIAPGANILLVETPVSETEGVTGFPQIVEAENYVVKHHLGGVISQSFSATEQTFTLHAPWLQGAGRLQPGRRCRHRQRLVPRLRTGRPGAAVVTA